MDYKVSAVIISDRLDNSDQPAVVIRQKTGYRVSEYDTLSDAVEKTRRKRVDLLIFSAALLSDKNLYNAEAFFHLHPSAVPVIIYNESQISDYSRTSMVPNAGLAAGYSPEELLAILHNANEIAKLKNQIVRDKSEIVRLLYQLDKMRRQSTKGHDEHYNSLELPVAQVTDNANLADDLAISGSLAKVFNQINNFSLKKIASTLEKELPDVLRIRKFSIFLLKNRLSKLDLFCSYNFPVQKKTELEISSLMESSIMFDAIFQRKVIHINDYAATSFAQNQQDNNSYEHNNCLCIPLVSGKKIVGVANFNDSQYGHFSSQQINLILIFANYLAVILDNLHKKA